MRKKRLTIWKHNENSLNLEFGRIFFKNLKTKKKKKKSNKKEVGRNTKGWGVGLSSPKDWGWTSIKSGHDGEEERWGTNQGQWFEVLKDLIIILLLKNYKKITYLFFLHSWKILNPFLFKLQTKCPIQNLSTSHHCLFLH